MLCCAKIFFCFRLHTRLFSEQMPLHFLLSFFTDTHELPTVAFGGQKLHQSVENLNLAICKHYHQHPSPPSFLIEQAFYELPQPFVPQDLVSNKLLDSNLCSCSTLQYFHLLYQYVTVVFPLDSSSLYIHVCPITFGKVGLWVPPWLCNISASLYNTLFSL